VTGSFSASDILNLTASGEVDNLPGSGPDGYTTNAAGVVTVNSFFGGVGSFSASGGGTFSSGALLIGNNTLGFKQLFDSASSGTGTTLIKGPVALSSIFGSGFTTATSLDFKIEPYSEVFSSARTANSIATGGSFASVPNAFTLNGTISQASAPTTAVPEPFTIIGTIIGGTAAFRMKKKLKSTTT
jgi:hypothetical protein